jgi:Tfp pilus assembly protein PilX
MKSTAITRAGATRERSQVSRQESGIALVIVIIALLLITAVAVGMIVLSNSEVNIDANYRDEQVALFAAKAGLEEARDRMLTTNANAITLPTVAPGSASSVAYVYATGISPWLSGSTMSTGWGTVSTYDSELDAELTATGLSKSGTWWTSYASNTNYSGPAANPLPYQWVRINLKLDNSSPYSVDGLAANKSNFVCFTGDGNGYHEVVSATGCSTPMQPVYEITSFALTSKGTRRLLQEEVTKDSFNLTIPGALTIDGPSLPASTICGSGSTCNGSGAYITGDEPASCSTGPNVPAIAVSDSTTATNFQSGASANKTNIVGCTNGLTPCTTGTNSILSETSALQNLSTVSEVETLVQTIEGIAGTNSCGTPQNSQSCSGATLNLGTAASPTVTVVNNATSGGAFQLNSGTTGYGILVVTGTLDYVNVNSYQGIILLLGTAQFIETSSKDTTFTGALIMAQDRNPSTGALLPGPNLGNGVSPNPSPGPYFNYHHGNANAGDPSIQFNQCVINQVETSALNNYRVLSQREIVGSTAQ